MEDNMYRWDVIYNLLKDKNDLNIAEIGVFEGKLTRKLLKNLDIKKFWLIDPYKMYPSYNDTKSEQKLLNQAYIKLQKEVLDKHSNVEHIKDFSEKASEKIANNTLDLVFIDGNHDYQYVMQDINLWSDKVKPGGIISGHDYAYPGIVGVKEAVDELFGDKVITTDDYVWYIKKEI